MEEHNKTTKRKLTEEHKRKISKFMKGRFVGELNGHYKGGTIHDAGYRRIYINGKQVFEHRHIMSVYLGRPLHKKEEIHHINGDKLDNRIENLEILSKSEHTKKHFESDPIKYRKRYNSPGFKQRYARN